MTELSKFNISKLDSYLSEFGIDQTWMNILATHICKRSELNYILSDSRFVGYSIFDDDLIEGLTIGEIGVLYEYCVSKESVNSRKSNGQYFTPDDVSKFMVSFADSFGQGVWLDPCSGIGNLSWHLVSAQEDPEEFLLNHVILSDKDALALFIARVLLTVSFQVSHSNLFDLIEEKFVVLDFLSTSNSALPELFTDSLRSIPMHDFVIVNPPYLAIEEDNRFETAKCRDLYGYFLDNIIKTSTGFISVNPQSYTNASKFSSLRRLLLRNFRSITIFNFDNVPANIFRGIKFGSTNTNTANSTRASILVCNREMGSHQITPLIRWTTGERDCLFEESKRLLASIELTETFFPKVSPVFADLYLESLKWPQLSTLISATPTAFRLNIPSSPRYFISALLSPVRRASQRVIYFRDEKSRDLAYLLINSSFMYWWWRVRDGGMTLSLETIRSLPVPDFQIDYELVQQLMTSEVTNKVYKNNAGAAQENVKHSIDTLNDLNRLVCPIYASDLILLHKNSDISNSRSTRN